MAFSIKRLAVAALLGALSACAVYPADYGSYPVYVAPRPRIVVRRRYFPPPPPPVFLYPRPFGYGHPRFYGHEYREHEHREHEHHGHGD
ncbi:MAG: hypothetical protein PHH59_00020 [Methylovulum sp.]|uniref:hypothetical protein n=1 Tax=Methylovulum sp. TaxID=1916980 RepID=UPI002601A0A8|nr:hypothetical protein [Methylovulum sp.]MDD2722394.1 hypothetical protein [Methylovulum sp.]MDD5125767.1 hypothetical protein [Methylovulum sp.]